MRKISIRRFLALFLSVILIVGVLSAFGFAQEKGEDRFVIYSTTRVFNVWEGLHRNCFRWYAEDQGWRYNTMQAQAEPTLQVTHIRRMVDMGPDGLVIESFNADVTAEGAKYADEHGVPVFTVDADTNYENVKMFVGFSGVRAGRRLAEKTIEYLKNDLEPIGETEGRILVVRGNIGNATADDRTNGFMEVVEKHDGITIETVIGEHRREVAKEAASPKVRARDYDVIYTTNGPMAIGTISAMEDVGKNVEDRFIVTIDAMPSVVEAIKEGKVDYALDQPVTFYNPIALYYLGKYLEEGESALPEVGETITAEDLTIEPAEHAGIVWWKDPVWAPAKITTNQGHLWFQTAGRLVDASNVDDPSLWSNADLPGW